MQSAFDGQSLAPGEHRLVCLACGGGSRKKNLGVTVNPNGSAVAHCFKCEYVETHRPQQGSHRRQPSAPRPAAKPKHEGLSDYGWQVWNETLAIADESLAVVNVARAYLGVRRCAIPPADSDLRWHPRLKHWPSGYEGPALVGLGRHAVTNAAMTLYRGWIKPDGTKPDIEPERMLLSGCRKAGAVVKLWPDECVTQGLGICEGVETALSLAHGYKPVWACIDAGNLAQFPVLDGIDFLVVGADHDEAGIEAAQRCAARWKAAGREAAVVMPRQPKFDLNDLARAAA